MKTTKRKLFVGLTVIAILGAASWVTAATINANTPNLSDLMIENLQVLSDEEVKIPVSACWHLGYFGDFVFYVECDWKTNTDPKDPKEMAIYPCPEYNMYGSKGEQSVCHNN